MKLIVHENRNYVKWAGRRVESELLEPTDDLESTSFDFITREVGDLIPKETFHAE